MKTELNIEAIWDEYRSGIQGFLRSRVSNAADVDDLLQEVMIKTYENLPTLKSEDSLKSWVFQIANRTLIDFYRANGRRQTEPILADIPDEKAEAGAARELSRCIKPFIKALPKESEELLTAIELQGVSQKEYARKAGINYSTLKSKVQKSRDELRDVFNDCCNVSVGAAGGIVDYKSKSNNCGPC